MFIFLNYCKAQTSTAVLVHNDSVQVFYGLNALVDAHNAAANGDIITLSSGTFTGVNLSKAVTIRGAGMRSDTAGIAQPTIIANDFLIYGCNDSLHSLVIEGIQHNGRIMYANAINPKFIKCQLNSVTYQYNYGLQGGISNAIFINCIIGSFSIYDNEAVNTTFYNSFIGYLSNHQATLYNCVCGFSYDYYYTPYLSAYNSILFANGGSGVDGYVFSNCVGIQTGTDGYGTSIPYFGYGNWANSNSSLTSFDTIFATFRGRGDSWDDNNAWYINESFRLTDNAATTYLGIDGTQVGIYGGTFPFDPVPNYITVKRCNVASRSTADGKLSVDIELISE